MIWIWYIVINKICILKKIELFFIFSIMIIIYEKIISKLDLNEKKWNKLLFFIEAKIILHRFI